jgi:NADH-quinone oxidoreductase subunit J
MAAFVVVGLAAVAAAVGVITARNAVHSVLWLIAHLCSLAVLYLTLNATFLGLVQILLYAGAVMVLFLFVVGLLSVRGDAEQLPRAQPGGLVGTAVAAGIVAAALLLLGAAGGALTGARALPPTGWGGVASFGAALFGPYLFPFEATALALLIAIVAVVALTQGHDEELARAAAAGGGDQEEPHGSRDEGARARGGPRRRPAGVGGGRR